jgi:hypothetical protein
VTCGKPAWIVVFADVWPKGVGYALCSLHHKSFIARLRRQALVMMKTTDGAPATPGVTFDGRPSRQRIDAILWRAVRDKVHGRGVDLQQFVTDVAAEVCGFGLAQEALDKLSEQATDALKRRGITRFRITFEAAWRDDMIHVRATPGALFVTVRVARGSTDG